MCDPLTLGSLAIGAAGTAASSIGQAKAAKKQKSEYEAWAEGQRRNRLNENMRQDEFQKKASASQAQAVEDLGAENQKALQDTEAARLESALAGEDAAAPGTNEAQASADAAISGGTYGGEVYQEDFARQLSDAMKGVKDRTKARTLLTTIYEQIDTDKKGITQEQLHQYLDTKRKKNEKK